MNTTNKTQIVPACKAYTIKWTADTPNTISLLLLRGPSSNVVPLGAPLAEGIPNSGSFVWTPASTLEADTTHYGLQLIDDVTGQYQYSTQFGISKDLCEVEVSSSVIIASTTAEPTATDNGYGYPTETEVAEPSSTAHGGYGQASSSAVVVSTPVYTATVIASSVVASTGYPVSNSTLLQPSKSLSVPASLQTTASATASSPAEFTGAASNIRAGLGLAGAVAGLVFML
jgi:hypothetical protein